MRKGISGKGQVSENMILNETTRGKMFRKIFLWFMAALAIIFVVGISSAYFAHQGFTRTELRSEFGEALDEYGPQAVETYENQGKEGLDSFLKLSNRKVRGRMMLFTSDGKPLLRLFRQDRPGNEQQEDQGRLEKFLMETLKENGTRFTFIGPLGILARKISSEKGNDYVFAAFRFVPPPFPSRENAGTMIFRLLAVLAAGAAACYWLANNMAVPIRKLREATQKLAQGDLGVRVEDKLTLRNDEIGDLGKGFNIMAEHLEDLIGAQKRLIGDISHELRTPLARLNIALGLARKRSGTEAETALNRIELETERLNDMIGQLLSLSRFETDMTNMQKIRINLTELVGDIVIDARFEAECKNCDVKFDPVKDIYIYGDPTLISRATENVIRNAIKHNLEDRDIEITMEGSCSTTKGNLAVIRVQDHGDGVDEKELENIFKPFYRLDSARDRKTGGTGLGLSIAERAVKLHGGYIRANNSPGGGLTVEIGLPMGDKNQ